MWGGRGSRLILIVELRGASTGRLTGDCCEPLLGLGYWIVHDCIHQADAEGLGRVQFFGSEEHLQGAAFADEAGKPLGASPPGDEAERGAAVAEDGMRGRDAMATSKGEIEASAHAVAFNGGVGGSGM